MRKQDVEAISLLQCISGMKERRKEGGEKGRKGKGGGSALNQEI